MHIAGQFVTLHPTRIEPTAGSLQVDSGFFYARNVNRFGGGVQRPGNLDSLANIWLYPVLIVQLIRRFGRCIVENKLTRGLSEMRPIEYAPLLFRDPIDSLHRRLNTVQVLVGDFALKRGALSRGEWNNYE
jgi:hypothetical protein